VHAIGLSYRNRTDLLYLSGGIVLISVALYLSHLGARGGE
jgi:hypothetical protein